MAVSSPDKPEEGFTKDGAKAKRKFN